MIKYFFIAFFFCLVSFMPEQDPVPPQEKIRKLEGEFTFKNATIISWENVGMGAALYFKDYLSHEKILAKKGINSADIFLTTDHSPNTGSNGYIIEILSNQIIITASNETGFKNAMNRLFLLCFEGADPKDRKLDIITLNCMELTHFESESSQF